MLPVFYFIYAESFLLKPEEVPKFTNVVFERRVYKNLPPDENGVSKTDIKITPFPLIPCREIKKNSAAYQKYNMYEENEYYKKNGDKFGM
jgi:hypothetical protein